MHKGSWKRHERRVASDFATVRIPVTGERFGADIRTPLFCIQTKLRNRFPTWLWHWFNGIRSVASQEGKIGILVLTATGQQRSQGLVVMSYGDFCALHGVPKHVEEPSGPTILGERQPPPK